MPLFTDVQQDRETRATQRVLDEKFREGQLSRLSVEEILEGIDQVEDFEERVYTLRKNSHKSLNTILLYTFDGKPWSLSPQEVLSIKYKVSEDDDVYIQGTNLMQEARRMYIFRLDTLPRLKAIQLLTELLENLHPKEAEVLKGMLVGVLPYKNITKELVATAFPDLFPEWKPKTTEIKEEEAPGKFEPEEVKTPIVDLEVPKVTGAIAEKKSIPSKTKSVKK